ncbi:multidrug resistance efflux transporter family protein [Psychrobacter sp. I-STPA10]|uniref:multidrug resistance efflux transporter family protein n=1 Tax=Psychrobacter sp. I-STPA10 TaxID=2585769 RepID=UPI001E308EDA|nr:multidrug resistance efflux transporter family protein [Psychrobacter sp. I-STPA10]
MIKLILLGLVAGAFFSSTFVLNELMSVAGGHWYWSASLRYVFMLILLTAIITFQHGVQRIGELWQVFRRYWQFWCVTGGIGFGLFYAGICYAADHASGWVVASTFMFTVVASLFVLYAFGRRFDRQVIVYAVMIFIGVVCANISEAMHTATINTTVNTPANPLIPSTEGLLQILLFGALPALIAAFSYPIGNQLVWQASHNAAQRHNTAATTSSAQLVSSWQRHIPTIDTELLGNGVNNAFNKVWLMTLGSLPFWLLLGVLIHPNLPSMTQAFNTFLVALCSGVIATSLFLYARGQADSTQEVAGVDATQASEVIFALIGGVLLLGTPLPSLLGWIGIALIVLGLVLFAVRQ